MTQWLCSFGFIWQFWTNVELRDFYKSLNVTDLRSKPHQSSSHALFTLSHADSVRTRDKIVYEHWKPKRTMQQCEKIRPGRSRERPTGPRRKIGFTDTKGWKNKRVVERRLPLIVVSICLSYPDKLSIDTNSTCRQPGYTRVLPTRNLAKSEFWLLVGIISRLLHAFTNSGERTFKVYQSSVSFE